MFSVNVKYHEVHVKSNKYIPVPVYTLSEQRYQQARLSLHWFQSTQCRFCLPVIVAAFYHYHGNRTSTSIKSILFRVCKLEWLCWCGLALPPRHGKQTIQSWQCMPGNGVLAVGFRFNQKILSDFDKHTQAQWHSLNHGSCIDFLILLMQLQTTVFLLTTSTKTICAWLCERTRQMMLECWRNDTRLSDCVQQSLLR